MALRDLIFYGDKGLPSKPTEDQFWGIIKIKEFSYRKTFGLSKKQMEEEDWEDFIVNDYIMAVIEERNEREMRKANKKYGRYKR